MYFEGPYALIPSFVLDSDLSDSELRLYAKISQLCNKLGFCYAKNAYLAEITRKSIPTINRILAKLAKKELIKIEIKNGRDRKIYLNLDFKYFCDKENIHTNEQKQPLKAKTEPKEYKDTTEQEKTLKTQDLKPKIEKPKIENQETENFSLNIPLPAFLDFKVWDRFCEYRKARFRAIGEMEAKNLFALWEVWENGGTDVNECILQSMANGWKSVYRLETAKKTEKKMSDMQMKEFLKNQTYDNPILEDSTTKAAMQMFEAMGYDTSYYKGG